MIRQSADINPDPDLFPFVTARAPALSVRMLPRGVHARVRYRRYRGVQTRVPCTCTCKARACTSPRARSPAAGGVHARRARVAICAHEAAAPRAHLLAVRVSGGQMMTPAASGAPPEWGASLHGVVRKDHHARSGRKGAHVHAQHASARAGGIVAALLAAVRGVTAHGLNTSRLPEMRGTRTARPSGRTDPRCRRPRRCR